MRLTSLKSLQKKQSRIFNNFHYKKENGPHDHQYGAHSPLQLNRNKVDQLRSRIFFEHPPVPHRVAKFFLAFCVLSCFYTGIKDKIKRKNKR
jgi:hypothetical protein